MRSVLLVFLCACGARDGVAAGGAQRESSGDTTVIRTTGDGVWGPAQDAVEVLRVGDSSRETTFGFVQWVAATPDGGVLVYDPRSADGKLIRQFGSAGHFIRNVGREGRGPGEYSFDLLAIDVTPTGTIVVREPFTGVKRYSTDGRFLDEFATDHRGSSHEIVAASDGSIYLRGSVTSGSAFGVAAMLRYDSTGRFLDSLAAGDWLDPRGPSSEYPTDLAPRQMWTVAPDGRVVIVRTDRVGFLIVDPSGRTDPVAAELNVQPILLSREERTELERIEQWSAANCGLIEGGRVVSPAPAATRVSPERPQVRAMQVDAYGRIWLTRRAPSVKGEPRVAMSCNGRSTETPFTEQQGVLSAFRLDGTYLGDVRLPGRLRRIAFTEAFLWTVVPDEDGVQRLVKLRLPELP